MIYKNLIIFSSVVIAIVGISFGLMIDKYIEDNGPITYMKYSYHNSTDTIVCEKVPLMPPFNCKIEEP